MSRIRLEKLKNEIHQALLAQFSLLLQLLCDNCINQNYAILEF
jgi:hypothetical protein